MNLKVPGKVCVEFESGAWTVLPHRRQENAFHPSCTDRIVNFKQHMILNRHAFEIELSTWDVVDCFLNGPREVLEAERVGPPNF